MNKQLQTAWKLKQSGLSNRKIALQMGVSHTLINRWLREYALSNGGNTPDKGKKKVSTPKKEWKPRLETLETSLETEPDEKETLSLPDICPTTTPVSAISTMETGSEKIVQPEEKVETTVRNVFVQYKYKEYCKEMNGKLSVMLNSMLEIRGKHIAKKRLEDLLQQAAKNTFENNFHFNEASASYPHSAFFKKLIYTLKDVLKQHPHSYQIVLKISEEDTKKIKEVLYELENNHP